MALRSPMCTLATSSSLQVCVPKRLEECAFADFFTGIGMVISAQWELVLGNTYAYTVLSAFGFFYGGFGAIITPLFGVASSYGTDAVEYNNALGFFLIRKHN